MDALHIRCPSCNKKLFEVGVYIIDTIEEWFEPYYEYGSVSWGDSETGDPFKTRIECASCNTEIKTTIASLTPILRHKAFISNAPHIERIEQLLRTKGE